MNWRVLRPLLLASTLLGAMLPAAWAAEPERTPEERRAYEAYDRGDFEAAAMAFAEAYRVTPTATVKYNEAYAWQRAGRLGPAADGYALALSLGGLDAERRRASEDRLADLRKRLGSVVVLRPEGGSVTVAHAVQIPIPARVNVTPGTHLVVVRSACGGSAERRVDLAAGQAKEVDLASVLGDCRGNPADRPPGKATPSDTSPGADGSTELGSQPQCVAGWVLLATGASAGIASAVLGVRTTSAINDFERTGNTDAELRSEAVTLRTWTNVAWMAAATLGTTGVVLLATAPGDDETPATEAKWIVGPSYVGSVVSW